MNINFLDQRWASQIHVIQYSTLTELQVDLFIEMPMNGEDQPLVTDEPVGFEK